MDPKRKAEILAGIKDPAVRAHYEAQLDMADELGDIEVGGIFMAPGSVGIFGPGGRADEISERGGRQFVKAALDEVIRQEPEPEPAPEALPPIPEPMEPVAVPPLPAPPSLGEPSEREFNGVLLAFAILVFVVLLVGFWYAVGP